VRAKVEARDARLAASSSFDRATLWFEHDLCDQLQLIQIVAWFSTKIREPGWLMLVQADDFLGAQNPRSIKGFRSRAVEIGPEHFKRANDAWSAFCQNSPELWARLVERDLTIFPHLPAAVLRMLEELPDLSGLSRSETAVLNRVAHGTTQAANLFVQVCVADTIIDFMGDWSFFTLLDRMATGPASLLHSSTNVKFSPAWSSEQRRQYLNAEHNLTPLGEAVLAGLDDYARHNQIDRWWGGTHLTNDNLWRWDAENRRLIPP
jgi:hypothetical protein